MNVPLMDKRVNRIDNTIMNGNMQNHIANKY